MNRLALIGLLCVTSCASSPQVAIHCPQVKPWSPAEQRQLKAEIDPLNADSMIVRWLSDYVAMRDKARACAEVQP